MTGNRMLGVRAPIARLALSLALFDGPWGALCAVSCGGNEFAVGDNLDASNGISSTSTSSDAPADAPTGVGPDAADGAPDWCSAQGTHLFCEDFAEGVPGQLASVESGGGMVMADDAHYPPGAKPPRSMLATTPSVPAAGGSATALGTVSFTTEGTHDVLQTEFTVSSTCFAGGDKDGVTALAVSFPEDKYLLAVVVLSSSSELLEITMGADGGVSSISAHPFTSQIPLDRWMLVSVDAHVAAPAVGITTAADTVTVKLDDVEVLSAEKLDLVPTLGAHHPTVGLGLSVKNQDGTSTGCSAGFDQILFDIEAT
jgi:hypothetical protein